MYLGFESPGITGGDGAFALPLLLGGVLKGDTSAASAEASGASEVRGAGVGSAECGLLGILGFPALFMGGGTGGADEIGRSLLRGSAAGPVPVCCGNSGLESAAGVPSRLGVLNLLPFKADPGVVGESRTACDFGRDGFGECIGDPYCLGGDLGDWIMTFGGDLDLDLDLVGDLGGEKAIMDVGLGLELLHGMRTVLARGVTVPAPFRFVRLGEFRPIRSLGMSSDMRPSLLLLSSATASRSFGAGERCRGVAGAGCEALLELIMFSKRARRSETGSCMILSAYSSSHMSCDLQWTSHLCFPLFRSPWRYRQSCQPAAGGSLWLLIDGPGPVPIER
jgi:hypothetical protein